MDINKQYEIADLIEKEIRSFLLKGDENNYQKVDNILQKYYQDFTLLPRYCRHTVKKIYEALGLLEEEKSELQKIILQLESCFVSEEEKTEEFAPFVGIDQGLLVSRGFKITFMATKYQKDLDLNNKIK